MLHDDTHGLFGRTVAETGGPTARSEGRDVLDGFRKLGALMPAQAATMYKGQGSEYPAVAIPVPTRHYGDAEAEPALRRGQACGKRLVG